jgi:Ca2+-binding RTX toxin-like protein
LIGANAINGNGNATNNIITGNGASNTLIGNDGNDTLDGGGGNDFLYGGQGDDTYYVDSSGDVTFEAQASWGTDTVYASSSYALGTNIDNLVLTGSANSNGAGNGLANTIIGNSGDNVLAGGAGDDIFVFAPSAGHDTLSDFTAGGVDDTLDLSAYNGGGVTWTISEVGADAVIAFSNGDSITLTNVDMNNLVAIDPWHYG